MSRFDQGLTGLLPHPLACSLLDRALYSYPIDLMTRLLLA